MNISLSSALLTKHDCIITCISLPQCNVVLAAYKEGFSKIEWCNFYSVDLSTIQIIPITTNISESWSNLFSTSLGETTMSQLFITGTYIYSFSSMKGETPPINLKTDANNFHCIVCVYKNWMMRYL